MARGWESKSVEQQQEEAVSQKTGHRVLTPEQAAEENRRRGLLLSRHCVVEQLEGASNPRHRQMLQSALDELDRQLQGVPPK